VIANTSPLIMFALDFESSDQQAPPSQQQQQQQQQQYSRGLGASSTVAAPSAYAAALDYHARHNTASLAAYHHDSYNAAAAASLLRTTNSSFGSSNNDHNNPLMMFMMESLLDLPPPPRATSPLPLSRNGNGSIPGTPNSLSPTPLMNLYEEAPRHYYHSPPRGAVAPTATTTTTLEDYFSLSAAPRASTAAAGSNSTAVHRRVPAARTGIHHNVFRTAATTPPPPEQQHAAAYTSYFDSASSASTAHDLAAFLQQQFPTSDNTTTSHRYVMDPLQQQHRTSSMATTSAVISSPHHSRPPPQQQQQPQPQPVRSSSSAAGQKDLNLPEVLRENWLASQDLVPLQDLQIVVSGISLEPLTAMATLERVRSKLLDVLCRYLPCVDFLVSCQQELRRGLQLATAPPAASRRRGSSSKPRTPRQFHADYVERLPDKFYTANHAVMPADGLHRAGAELQQLRQDARQAERHGCEAVKNAFLGGMKDGESWGLRRWLSKHGAALPVCTDLECIQAAVQKLDRGAASTVQLCALLRPLAQATLNRLRSDIPTSYQEHSTAHPYLPFFHRLESCLRTMATYSPEEDDVICLDDSDDDDDDIVVQPVPSAVAPRAVAATGTTWETNAATTKRSRPATNIDLSSDEDRAAKKRSLPTTTRLPEAAPTTTMLAAAAADSSSSGESDNESVIEVVGIKVPDDEVAAATTMNADEWMCYNCGIQQADRLAASCLSCGERRDLLREFLASPAADEDDFLGDFLESTAAPVAAAVAAPEVKKKKAAAPAASLSFPLPLGISAKERNRLGTKLREAARHLDELAVLFDQGQESRVRPRGVPGGKFWDVRYAAAIRIFVEVLRAPEAAHFWIRVRDEPLIRSGNPPFGRIIRNPLSFQEVVLAVLGKNALGDPAFNATTASGNGLLPSVGLRSWNVWKGSELLQAVDLVLLNSLAYGKCVGEGKSDHRTQTTHLRRLLWQRIHVVVQNHVGDDATKKKQATPIRRGETSGFVVYKEENGSA
jgi:hypothetical protein